MVFRAFAKMVDSVAPAGIFRAVELQGQMLVKDVVNGRTDFDNDIFSILCFWRYLTAAKEGRTLGGFANVPHEQVEFYKRTISRMATARELPPTAPDDFGRIPEIANASSEPAPKPKAA